MLSFRAYWNALWSQMVNDPLPPERVAAGWALGMFVGCAVPFGVQLVVSIPLAVLLRVSKIGASVATFITNPLTILVIYPLQTLVGSRLLGAPLTAEYVETSCAKLAKLSLFDGEGWRTLAELGGMTLGSFFLGGLLLAAICTPVTYYTVRHVVRRYRSICQKNNT